MHSSACWITMSRKFQAHCMHLWKLSWHLFPTAVRISTVSDPIAGHQEAWYWNLTVSGLQILAHQNHHPVHDGGNLSRAAVTTTSSSLPNLEQILPIFEDSEFPTVVNNSHLPRCLSSYIIHLGVYFSELAWAEWNSDHKKIHLMKLGARHFSSNTLSVELVHWINSQPPPPRLLPTKDDSSGLTGCPASTRIDSSSLACLPFAAVKKV